MATPRSTLILLAASAVLAQSGSAATLPIAPVHVHAFQRSVGSAVTPANSLCSGMGLGVNGALNGFVPASTDAWHQNISSATVDPSSATIINTAGDLAGYNLHPDFGTQYGIPYVVVDSRTQPNVSVPINLYGSESDITVAPVPANAPIEGNPLACTAPAGDQHVLVLDRNSCVDYEYWTASSCNGAWSASDSALWDMTTPEKRPYGYTSADAAGLSVFEGLIRYDEIIAGSINHAIRFTAKYTKTGPQDGYYVAPATHSSGNLWGTDNIIGMRIRLKAGFDISHYSKTNQIILTAMKNYGMILADNGTTMFFQGTQDNRWDDNDLSSLSAVPSSAFEVVTMGTVSTMWTPPATGAAPTIQSFTASATSVKAGATVVLTAVAPGASYSYVDKAGFMRNGTVSVSPTATTTYTLTSRNAFGSVSKSLTVTVVQ
ncbi:hypothetical protein SAMN05421819_1492 [Bryocella elongata]|uniref:Ig-like domain-containing protein n=1 Tax=Bryocella elongata TaxID=863522 RepID=A0A1H5WAK4_9BACT|nr:hypothetical protein [Bryocella elongata]SEF96221.1 hypothetical protein SAMN05421819_1492 [Bryocella elongata]